VQGVTREEVFQVRFPYVHNTKKLNWPTLLFKGVSKQFLSLGWVLMGLYNQSLSLDGTIVVSKNCPIISEQVVIFLT